MPWLPALPFLVVSLLAVPLLAWRSRRWLQQSSSRDEAALPSTRALTLQTLVLQGMMAGLAWLAAWSTNVRVHWWAVWSPTDVLLAAGVLAIALLFAMREARCAVASTDPLRQRLRQIHITDPWWITAAIAAAIAEEYCYRGVLTALLGGPLGLWPAALLSALAFGGAHLGQGWRGGCFGAVFGLGLQALCFVHGGLLVAILVHFAYDMLVGAWGHRLAEKQAAADA